MMDRPSEQRRYLETFEAMGRGSRSGSNEALSDCRREWGNGQWVSDESDQDLRPTNGSRDDKSGYRRIVKSELSELVSGLGSMRVQWTSLPFRSMAITTSSDH